MQKSSLRMPLTKLPEGSTLGKNQNPDPPRMTRYRMKRYPIVQLSLAVFLLTLVFTHSLAAKDKPPKPVTLTEVKKSEIRQEISLLGSSIAWRRAEISPRIDGLVTSVLTDTGQAVRQGEPLLQLDNRLAEIDLQFEQAQLAAAKARRLDAQRKLNDLKRLKGNRHVPASSIDTAEADLQVASADVASASAGVARAEELLARHSLPAPFNGVITAKYAETGQWIKRDQPAVEMIELDTLRVRVPLPQRQYPDVQPGDPATIVFDALPDAEFSGKVVARVATGDQSSRSFPVLIDIANPNHDLAPGMSARVVLGSADPAPSGLLVSRDAIVSRSNGDRLVWKVNAADGQLTVQPIKVQAGRTQGALVEVSSDELNEGDRVVELGNETLKPGQVVIDRSADSGRVAR